MPVRLRLLTSLLSWMAFTGVGPLTAAELSRGVTFISGAVNGVIVERDGAKLAVYGDPRETPEIVERVLFTHHRRDVTWAGRPCVAAGARAVAPKAEEAFFSQPEKFWKAFRIKRFHDYEQQSTKIHSAPLAVERFVKGGDTIDWRGLSIQVLDTPGFTRGSVSYLVDLDGKKVAFTGDLIHGDGKIFDLYSFQDAVPEAGIGGYHGYASRFAALITSLEKVAAEKPDLLVPVRGPVIDTPQKSISTLIRRVRAVYRNYLSTNALSWYMEDSTMKCAGRILEPGTKVDPLPRAKHKARPSWLLQFATTSVLLSETKNALIFDCGYDGVIDSVKALQKAGTIKAVEGIIATHHHDDHTDKIQAAVEAFGCPTYSVPVLEDVLENPRRYRIPCMTSNPIKDVRVLGEGEVLTWHEYRLTFHFFPGQTYYHGATLLEKNGAPPLYFIGDSFSPAGVDDYCVLNRNLLHEDAGFPLCLRKLRAAPENTWLVNQHIAEIFRFENTQIDLLDRRLRERMALLRELFPWDDLNYGIDERWVEFYPYGVEARPGSTLVLRLRFVNHSPGARSFRFLPRPDAPIKLVNHARSVTVNSRQEKSTPIRFKIPKETKPGLYLVTTDVESEGMAFREWAEAMITVTAP